MATYGQVASVARLPRQARLVGYALNVLPPGSSIPWFRVVNAKGTISLRSNGLGHDELLARLLTREGVRFVDGAIPLDRSGGARACGRPSLSSGTSASDRACGSGTLDGALVSAT